MKMRILLGVVAFAFLFAATTNPSHAQANALAVTIARPSEGEIIYSGPGAPYVCVPVTGWVTADQIDVASAQVKLELYQGARIVGSLTTQPAKDGQYWFDVAINESNPDDHPVAECAQSKCHIFSSLSFPAGRVLARVTATDSLGRKAVAERSVLVDHSGSVNVPVQVVVEGESNTALQGINLSAMTRVYEWRARQYVAGTDANGRALFNVEALGQAPTRYVFRLDPVVVDGVQYSSREYTQLTLPPGATTADPVKLVVQALRGQVAVTVTAPNRMSSPLTVHAVQVPSGRVHSAKTADGQVRFNNLSVDKHLIAVDAEELASQGLSSPWHTIDLITQPITSTRILLTTASTQVVRGMVHDSQGNPLPLVWLAPDEQGKSIRTFPGTGEFVRSGVPFDARSLWVVAPGYWRRAVAVDFDRLDIELAREPDTQSVSWGNGTITVPPESLAEIAGNRIGLRRGWLWGRGTGTFTAATPDAEIELSTGTFALESLPDAPSWLYIIDGQAKVTLRDSRAEIQVTSGQMLAFGFSVTRPFPVPLDNTAIRALHAEESIPVRIATNPDPLARLQDELGRRGISFMHLAILATALAIIIISGIVLGNRKSRPT